MKEKDFIKNNYWTKPAVVLLIVVVVFTMCGCSMRLSDRDLQFLDEKTAEAVEYYYNKYQIRPEITEKNYSHNQAFLVSEYTYNKNIIYFYTDDDTIIVYNNELKCFMDNKQEEIIKPAMEHYFENEVEKAGLRIKIASTLKLGNAVFNSSEHGFMFNSFFDGDPEAFLKYEKNMNIYDLSVYYIATDEELDTTVEEADVKAIKNDEFGLFIESDRGYMNGIEKLIHIIDRFGNYSGLNDIIVISGETNEKITSGTINDLFNTYENSLYHEYQVRLSRGRQQNIVNNRTDISSNRFYLGNGIFITGSKSVPELLESDLKIKKSDLTIEELGKLIGRQIKTDERQYSIIEISPSEDFDNNHPHLSMVLSLRIRMDEPGELIRIEPYNRVFQRYKNDDGKSPVGYIDLLTGRKAYIVFYPKK